MQLNENKEVNENQWKSMERNEKVGNQLKSIETNENQYKSMQLN